MAAAGQASQGELADNEEKWQKQKEELLRRQKEMERIGAMPDFADAAEKEKRQGLSRISSDSLLKTGNFLGENAGNFTDIARQQLDLLRLIEANTRPSASSGAGGDTVNFGNP
jgi:Tfp pilus assembly protein PilP